MWKIDGSTDASLRSEDVFRSRSRALTAVGWVADDYSVEEGRIIRPRMGGESIDFVGIPPEGVHFYLPGSRPELPAQVAKIEDEETALAFVRRYGLLGFDAAFRESERTVDGTRRRLEHGDPVEWVLSHARTIRLVMLLAEAIDDSGRLRSILADARANPNARTHFVFVMAARGNRKPVAGEVRYSGSDREDALRVIADVLNWNLGGISRGFVVERQVSGSLGLTSMFLTQNLLDCVYWLLADAVTAARVGLCLECRNPFVVTHDARKFCPRPYDHRVSNEVSPCMNRYKQRMFRLRQKALRLRKDGTPLGRIAAELQLDRGTVREWLTRPGR